MGVRNSDELREVYETLQPQMVQFFSTIGQSEATYQALRALRDSEAWADLSAAQKRMVEKEELGMKLSGIGLEGEDKERFNVIQMELAELATGFSNSVLDSLQSIRTHHYCVDRRRGFSETLRQMTAASAQAHGHEDATPEAGPWRITLDAPVAGPFLMHCQNRALREQVYRAMISVASMGDLDNGPRIEKILNCVRKRRSF